MLVLPNVTMELSKYGEKNNYTTKCDKSMVRVMLVLPNVTIELSNMRRKKKKKKKVPPNASKVRSEVMLILFNVTIELSNVRKLLYI